MAKKITQKADSWSWRWQRTHPALVAGLILTAAANRQENQRVLFRAADTDSACSIHSLCTVLVTLNLARGQALTHMAHRRHGLPAAVFREFSDFYFTGCMAADLVERVNRLGLPLKLTARYQEHVDLDYFAVRQLHLGHLVILSFRSIFSRKTHHAAVGTGLSGFQKGQVSTVDTILMLDSACEEIPMSAFNARLRVQTPAAAKTLLKKPTAKPISWLYDSPDWPAEVVQLTGAVCFKRIE